MIGIVRNKRVIPRLFSKFCSFSFTLSRALILSLHLNKSVSLLQREFSPSPLYHERKRHSSHRIRLFYSGHLHHCRYWHWVCSKAPYEKRFRLPSFWRHHTSLGYGIGISLGQPWCSRGYRYGCFGCQIRYHDIPILLGGSDSSYALPRGLHDAVLFWLPGPFGAGVSRPALR